MSCLLIARCSRSNMIVAVPDSYREFVECGGESTCHIRADSRGRIQYIDASPVVLLDGNDMHQKKRMDLSPELRQTVKTHFSLNGELSHGIVATEVHERV